MNLILVSKRRSSRLRRIVFLQIFTIPRSNEIETIESESKPGPERLQAVKKRLTESKKSTLSSRHSLKMIKTRKIVARNSKRRKSRFRTRLVSRNHRKSSQHVERFVSLPPKISLMTSVMISMVMVTQSLHHIGLRTRCPHNTS